VPETYLAALVQMTCRKKNWPLDRSIIYTTVSKFSKPDDVEERPDEVNSTSVCFSPPSRFIFDNNLKLLFFVRHRFTQGCYVYGLYLEGARWDVEKHCLKRSHPKVLIEELPILTVIPTEAHRRKLQVTLFFHVSYTCMYVVTNIMTSKRLAFFSQSFS